MNYKRLMFTNLKIQACKSLLVLGPGKIDRLTHSVQSPVESDLRLDEAAEAVVGAEERKEVG